MSRAQQSDRHRSPAGARPPGRRRAVVLFGLLATLAPPLFAQSIRTITFELQKETAFEEGCFAPCLCPVLLQDDVRGGFTLSFVGWDGDFRVYRVGDVDWSLPSFGRQYTGDGEFRIGGGSKPQQRLQLNLSENGGLPVPFDSGLVDVTVRLPRIDVAIARNGFYCHDTAFYLRAAPARPITLGVRIDPGRVAWDDYADAAGYDVVGGRLGLLLSSGGDFQAATEACLATDQPGAAIDDPSLPPPGEGLWYVVRAHGGVAGSTYDCGAEVDSRDAGIDAAPAACP
jgi:hypothetical protein